MEDLFKFIKNIIKILCVIYLAYYFVLTLSKLFH